MFKPKKKLKKVGKKPNPFAGKQADTDNDNEMGEPVDANDDQPAGKKPFPFQKGKK